MIRDMRGLPTKNLRSKGLSIDLPAVVAVLGKDALLQAVAAESIGADILEVRLDLVEGDPIEVIRGVRKITHLPIIATNRMREEGGGFLGDETDRIEILCSAARWADLVDIELSSEEREHLMKRIKKPVIVSYHNFEGMPGPKELRFILDEIYNTNADIAKVAVTPERLRDNLQLLSLLLGAFRPTCIIGMGEIGRHLRAVAPLYGSVLTYGHLGEAFAPGQMSVSELFQALRILGSGSG